MNILLGSCGGLTGIYLAKQYRDNHYLVGIDNNDKSTGKYFVNDFIVVPGFKQENFVYSIIKIIKDYKIDVYIPTHSEEISIISENKDKIEKYLTGKLTISNIQTIRIFENKLKAYTEVSKKGIKCPKIIENETNINRFPILLKPIISSGSRGIIRINTLDEYRLYSAYKNFFICDFYECDEYTVDCFFSNESVLVGYYVRKRVKNIGGAVSITESAMELDISKEMETLEKEFSFIGPINFQFFFHEGEIIFFDFNLRFASGGIPLTVHAGFAIPDLLLKESMGIPYTRNMTIDTSKMTMHRYFEELFF